MVKHTAEACPVWDFILKRLRALVEFFHVATWRTFIRKALALNPPPDFDRSVLMHFTATFAKWRYETLADVTEQLRPLRVLCERYMQEAWFANSQEKAKIRDAFDAFTDKRLWRLIEATGSKVFSQAEKDRRWGMVCVCHERERREGQHHIECFWNSRKLPWAADRVHERIDYYRTQSRSLTLADCEGDAEVWEYTKNMLLKMSTSIKQRLGYLGLPPWTAVRCRSQEGCDDFLKQVQACPMEQHDPYTRWFMDKLGAHVVARSRGEDLHVDLENELDRLATVPLDESCGEGIHRDIAYELKRASGSKQAHLKQSARRKGVFRRLRTWRKTHGKKGRAVLRWEWVHWKRIAQTNPRRKWRGSSLDAKSVYGLVHREDDRANMNWVSVVSREANVHRARTDDETNADACWNEYVRGQVHDGRHYTCMRPSMVGADAVGPANRPREPPQEEVFFHLLGTAHGSHRAHVMPTIATPRDVSVTASMALEVQWLQRTTTPSRGPNVGAEVEPVGEPVWVTPRSIAPFTALANSLMEFKTVRESEFSDGIVVLAEPERACYKGSVLDQACPVLCVIHYLKNRGWVPVNHPMIHDTPNVGRFDGTEAIRYRGYFQCLVALERTFPLTSRLPSREPVAYYRLLLAGQAAAKELQLALNAQLRKKGKKLS